MAAAAALTTVSSVSAHGGAWYVTRSAAERNVNLAFKEVYPSVPMSTRCVGWGGSLAPNKPGGQRFFKHHKCSTEVSLPDRTPRLRTTLHVINKHYVLITDGWGPSGRELARLRYR